MAERAEQTATNENVADTETTVQETQETDSNVQERVSTDAPEENASGIVTDTAEPNAGITEQKERTEESKNEDEESATTEDKNGSLQTKSSKKSTSTSKIENTASTSNNKNNTSNNETDEFCEKISNQSSNISLMCRICYDDTLDEPIISPCKCKGTVGMMHKSCLEKWLAESNTSRCDLCFHRFETERTTKFSVYQSIYRWLRYPPSSFAFPIRDMRSDMITCLVLIPFSFLLVYLCLFASEYYNRQNFSVIPVARWTAISVMLMGIIIVLGFCAWIYLVLRYHSRVWYFWWQRETIVRIHM